MKSYCVWFPRLAGYMGKRGLIVESPNNAIWFWNEADAAAWADVLGGTVRQHDYELEQQMSGGVEEPF